MPRAGKPFFVQDQSVGATILLVEDDADSREALAVMLRDAGFTVVECDNGREALARLVGDNALPAAIVLDLAMPIMSGQELLRVLRNYLRFSHVPIIVVTGVSEPIDDDAVVARLTKPVDPRDLVQKVQAVTG